MTIHLEQLEHQEKAVEAVLKAMKDCRLPSEMTGGNSDFNEIYANPKIELKEENLKNARLPEPESLGGKNIDVKMETGTGKTYVYTRLMYELYKNFELNKFIIFVPSLPIKEGTKNFISADYTRRHFYSLYENVKIDLDTINAGAFNVKKGRKTLPSELIDYLEASRNNRNTIKCLLINDAMLMSKSMTRGDYDQTLFGGLSCPVDALKQTRPVVIIDEPHRFKKDGKAYKAVCALNPQLIIRFGATFPDIEFGSGQNKTSKKDYENLVYNLGSIQAFNGGLVKAVDIHYPETGFSAKDKPVKYKVKNVLKRDKKIILSRLADNKDFEIRIYEKFPSDFDGVELGLDDDNDLAINDMKINEGLILLPGVFSMSYQELLLSQAIDKHFAKERENWFRQNGDLKAPKIKTLSLFFIDNIKSYREDGGWLRAKFETLLRNKLDTLISKETDEQYKLFLKATRSDLSGSHAGYFAKDNAKADEDIQKEIDDILRNKDEMLSFKRDDGSWNIRRFLFSKWTLREGWDNPNVFVIAKLRTSGSEISKLQEVGRGLRLPVDENGKRLSAEEFRLDYIVDWSEKDFADSLIAEINNDNLKISNDKITDAIVNKLVEVKYADNDDKVKAKLLLEDIIDGDDKILKKEALLALLPKDFIVRRGKITDNGRNRRPKIKLRERNWEHLKDLWSKVTKRYFLQFEKLETSDFNKILSESLNGKIFVSPKGSITSVSMKFNDEKKQFGTEVSTSDAPAQIGVLPYGEFLKRLSKETSINPKIWHLAFVKKFNAPIEKELINNSSLKNIIENYKKTFGEVFAQKYKYDALDYSADTSLIKDGKFVGELEQNLIGTTLAESIAVEENYLYDKKAYDSDIEREVLQRTPAEQVLTFGKLPRRSIKVPTYTGGTTSPDFVYAIKDENGKVKLNLLIETKAKDTRLGENIALEAQKKLFANIENVKWHMINDADKISQILNELIQ